METRHQRSAVSGQPRVVVVTGSDTGVGKTVLTSLLTRRLRAAGISAETARAAGIDVRAQTERALAIGGALAGLVGANFVMGYKHAGTNSV